MRNTSLNPIYYKTNEFDEKLGAHLLRLSGHSINFKRLKNSDSDYHPIAARIGDEDSLKKIAFILNYYLNGENTYANKSLITRILRYRFKLDIKALNEFFSKASVNANDSTRIALQIANAMTTSVIAISNFEHNCKKTFPKTRDNKKIMALIESIICGEQLNKEFINATHSWLKQFDPVVASAKLASQEYYSEITFDFNKIKELLHDLEIQELFNSDY